MTPLDAAHKAAARIQHPAWAILRRARTLAKHDNRTMPTVADVIRAERRVAYLKRKGK